jgi:hypothetical protein
LSLGGDNAPVVNGAYIKLDEQKNGKSVYMYGKVGKPTYCCWYDPNRKWKVSRTTSKNANKASGWAKSAEEGLDAPQLVKGWNVGLGAQAVGQSNPP